MIVRQGGQSPEGRFASSVRRRPRKEGMGHTAPCGGHGRAEWSLRVSESGDGERTGDFALADLREPINILNRRLNMRIVRAEEIEYSFRCNISTEVYSNPPTRTSDANTGAHGVGTLPE